MTTLTEKDLQEQIQSAKQHVEINACYTHYRDLHHPYKVLQIALLESTQEPAVIYQKANNSDAPIWIRPLSSWLEKVETEKGLVPRFSKC